METQNVSGTTNDLYKANLRKSSSAGLNVDDFLILLAAQLSNQDMMNPMSDTEFMGQLAQFTTLQAVQQLQEMNTTAYSVSLIGKEVTVARVLSTGELQVTTDVVTGVGLYNGEPVVYVGGNAYSLEEIMAVGSMPTGGNEEGDGEDGSVTGPGNGGADETGGLEETQGTDEGSGTNDGEP